VERERDAVVRLRRRGRRERGAAVVGVEREREGEWREALSGGSGGGSKP